MEQGPNKTDVAVTAVAATASVLACLLAHSNTHDTFELWCSLSVVVIADPFLDAAREEGDNEDDNGDDPVL